MPKTRKPKSHVRTIVTGYLEKVNASVFDRYQREITDMTRGQQGIYALYRKNKLYYVGLATNLRNRIKHHLKDRHKDHWTHFSLYIIRKVDHIKELESLLLRIAFPEGNSQKGKLQTSTNLIPSLKLRVKRKIQKEYEDLFKGYRLEKPEDEALIKAGPKQKLHKATSERPLKGYFPGGKRLIGKWKGQVFKAWVYSSGTVKYNGRLYVSPSAAGKAVRKGRETNGWSFWHTKDPKGQLVKLSTLRK